MNLKVIIVDYGLGNIRSVQKSVENIFLKSDIKGEVVISSTTSGMKDATHYILPGQGAFKSCIDGLKKLDGMIEELSDQVLLNKKPILGICVGMQLFAEQSFENGVHKGLGWIKGEVLKLPKKNLCLPHMGWNEIKCLNDHPITLGILSSHFYFVHSYYFNAKISKNILATSNYGIEFPSFVVDKNIFGVQFHPEKSSDAGQALLSNFLIQK